jgi:hypothetical protein
MNVSQIARLEYKSSVYVLSRYQRIRIFQSKFYSSRIFKRLFSDRGSYCHCANGEEVAMFFCSLGNFKVLDIQAGPPTDGTGYRTCCQANYRYIRCSLHIRDSFVLYKTLDFKPKYAIMDSRKLPDSVCCQQCSAAWAFAQLLVSLLRQTRAYTIVRVTQRRLVLGKTDNRNAHQVIHPSRYLFMGILPYTSI